MPLELLAIGDMHLGRRPSRLPDELAASGRSYGPAEAWSRAVGYAIETGVDVVALAGDLVDRDDDFFEAYRALREGISELGRNGIEVLGIAGNHDVLVLPRLAGELPDFRLLGAGGAWETRHFDTLLTLHGWSFPTRSVGQSPLAGHAFERGPGVNLGLLHCDRDARDSRYAPVASTELDAAGLDGWLLGHIHKPDELTPERPTGYLGSITGMHPGEHGARGPWRFRITENGIDSVEQVRLAPLHWARVSIDLTGIECPEDAESRLLGRLQDLDGELEDHEIPPNAMGLRVRLTGRTDRINAVLERFEKRTDDNLSGHRERFAFIETIEASTRPTRDLEKLAATSDHIGLLARRLLLLDRPPDDPARRALLDRARERLDRIAGEPRWHHLGQAPSMQDQAVAERLRDSCARVLERLIEQREGRQ